MAKNSKSSQEKPSAFYALVRGKVQGVGFRYSTVREAERLSINGWVRNCRDGNVEVWAEGPDDKLAAFLEWLNRGPQFSRVDSVRAENKDSNGYSGFIVEY